MAPPTHSEPSKGNTSKSSPIKHRVSERGAHSSAIFDKLAKFNYHNNVKDMKGEYIGPMPVADFIKDFLPQPAERPCMPLLKKSFREIGTKTSENEIVAAINDSGLCPHLVFYNTSQGSDNSNPDMSGYHRSVNVENTGIIVWPSMELFMERKPKDQDAFQDPIAGRVTDLKEFNFESDTAHGQHTRGQITQYAMEQFRYQFRVFCLSVLWLDGGFVRFIRWDRSGAVVTERLNIREDPRTLAEFFWRFGHLNAEQRGRDPTVQKATGNTRIKAEQCFNDPENQKYLIDADGKPQGTFARRSDLWEITIHDDQTEEDRIFIIASPLTTTEYLTGRCSFGYIAYDVKDNRLVYLKDTWRIDLPDIQKEGSTYRTLHDNGVRHISGLVTAGDVIGQRALSKDYQDKPWVCGKPALIPHQHYRLALESIGRPLSTFKSSNQLYVVVHHALEGKSTSSKVTNSLLTIFYAAHSDAHSKAKILHRDVSAGNILIDVNGEGLLIDWDLSKKASAAPQPRRDWRTGTWQFISIDILKDPDMYHELRHDLESFFWVLLYHALRYIDSPIPMVDLPQIMAEVFDEAKRLVSRQIWIGGNNKVAVVLQNTWNDNVPKDDFYEPMLGQLLAKFRALIAPLYQGADARKTALPNFADSTKVLELFDSFGGLGFPENDPSIDRLAPSDNKRKADEDMDRDLQDPMLERRSKRSRVSQRG